jgi:hypothetical protein
MTAWMEYMYQQQPKPTNATGVPVELFVVDANGNYRSIGTTTSDATGFYSLEWTPDIAGKYTVYAMFAGSESYYASQATTAFAVDQPAQAATPQPTAALSMADVYFLPAMAIVVVLIVIILALLLFMLVKKR